MHVVSRGAVYSVSYDDIIVRSCFWGRFNLKRIDHRMIRFYEWVPFPL